MSHICKLTDIIPFILFHRIHRSVTDFQLKSTAIGRRQQKGEERQNVGSYRLFTYGNSETGLIQSNNTEFSQSCKN